MFLKSLFYTLFFRNFLERFAIFDSKLKSGQKKIKLGRFSLLSRGCALNETRTASEIESIKTIFLLVRHWKSYFLISLERHQEFNEFIRLFWVFDRFDIWVDYEALCFCPMSPKEVFWVLIVLTMLTSPISTILHIKKVCGGVWDIWDHSIPD